MEDRSAAIVAVTLVEDAIQDCILSRMRKLKKSEHEYLFEGVGPLATFSAKIRVAHALKLIDRDWVRQFEIIKDIQNTFAQARSIVDFETPEIVNATSRITVTEGHRNPIVENLWKGSTYELHQIANSVRLHDPRSRFIGSCLYFAFHLWDIPPDPDDWDEDEDDT